MNHTKIIFAFFIFAILAKNLDAQSNISWFKQYDFPEEYRINTITFIDSLCGWAAGWKITTQINGLIVHTDDGGKSWSEQLLDSTFSNTWFNDLQFLDKNNGWATGLYILYKTINGGQNWSRIPDSLFTFENDPFLNGLADMQSVSFIDINRGMISGTESMVSSTMDGGQTWYSSFIIPEEGFIDTLHYVTMINADTACAVGMGGIAITTNGGELWQLKHSDFRNYKKCVFVNNIVGWTLSSDSQILYTDNAGQTWQDLGRIYQDLNVVATNIEFVDEMTGWVITSAGTIWKTEDGGFSWNVDTLSNNQALTSVDFIKEEIGFATDVTGGFFRTKLNENVVVDDKSSEPVTFSLLPNYPNPFNPVTTISYELPWNAYTIVGIYSTTGQLVQTLVNEEISKGKYRIVWNASNLSSGVYICRFQAGDYTRTNKMLLIK